MNIVLNNLPFETKKGLTCAQLITQLSYQNMRIALEVNHHIIPKSQYNTTSLKPNDKVEIVKAVGGG